MWPDINESLFEIQHYCTVTNLKKVSDEEFPTALRKALPLKSSAAIKELVDMFGAPDEASSILVRRSDLPPLSISYYYAFYGLQLMAYLWLQDR